MKVQKKVAAFEVRNAATKEDAIKAAKALSNSLLVKTALFGKIQILEELLQQLELHK